jgi:predicted dehydrogenase
MNGKTGTEATGNERKATMSTIFRAGIIGCSPMAIGSRPRLREDGTLAPPATHADGYEDLPATELVAVCDLDPAALDRFAAFHGSIAARYTDPAAMLANEALDIVSIVTPDNRHRDLFVAAAHAGVQGILCEKPVATSLDDADAMLAAVRETGVKAIINHTRRFDERHRRVLAELDRGAIGTVHHLGGILGGSRAMLFRLGTHMINTMMMFAPAPPIWVQAAYADQDAGYGVGYHGDGGRNPDLEPAATAIFGFADGTRATYSANKTIANQFDITVYGETGSVTIGNQGGAWQKTGADGTPVQTPLTGGLSFGPAIILVIETLLDRIAHDGDCLADLQEARATLAVLLAITESAAQQGTRVRIDPM